MSNYDMQTLVQNLRSLMANSTNIVRNATEWITERARLNEQYSYMLLTIILDTQNNLDIELKTMASTALYDEIKDNYSKNLNQDGNGGITENAKNYLRSQICDAVSVMAWNKPIRKNLEDVLFKMIITDFPTKWEQCIPQVINKMNTANNPGELYGSLLCVKTILAVFAYKVENTQANLVQESIFPLLESIIIAQINTWNPDSPRIVKLILKSVLHTSRIDISEYFKNNDK